MVKQKNKKYLFTFFFFKEQFKTHIANNTKKLYLGINIFFFQNFITQKLNLKCYLL